MTIVNLQELIDKWRARAEDHRAAAERYDNVGEREASLRNHHAWMAIDRCANELEAQVKAEATDAPR